MGKGADCNGLGLPAAAVAPQALAAQSAGVAAADPASEPAKAAPGQQALKQKQKKRKAPGAMVFVDTPAGTRRKALDAPASAEEPATSTHCPPPSSMAEHAAQPGASGRDTLPVTVDSKANPGGPGATRFGPKSKGPGKKWKRRKLQIQTEASGGTPIAVALSRFSSSLPGKTAPAASMLAASAPGRLTATPLANGSGRARVGKALHAGAVPVIAKTAAGAGSVKSRLRQLQTAKEAPVNGTPGMTESARKKVHWYKQTFGSEVVGSHKIP